MRNRSLVVATREFLSTVKSTTFILTTFGMPVIGLLIGVVSAFPGGYLAAKEALRDRGSFALVDESGTLAVTVTAAPRLEPIAPTPTPTPTAQPAAPASEGLSGLFNRAMADAGLGHRAFQVARVATRDEALAGIRSGRFQTAIIVPQDYIRDGYIFIYENGQSGALAAPAEPTGPLRSYLVDAILEGKVPPVLRDRAKDPLVDRIRFRLSKTGEFEPDEPLARIGKMAVPLAMMIFLLLAIFVSAGYLMRGVAEEKENRVLEVILSSVSPGELLTGKLLGLGAAGLIQMLVWACGMLLPLSHILPMIEVRPLVLAIAFVEFILGYLLFGSLVLGFGSLGGNFRESQQWSAVFSVAGGMIPALFMPIVLDEPGGTFARVLSIIPPTAPVCMTMRAALVDVPAYDLLLSAVLMSATVYVALRASARVYRAGTLMIGKTATVREVWRILRTPEEP